LKNEQRRRKQEKLKEYLHESKKRNESGKLLLLPQKESDKRFFIVTFCFCPFVCENCCVMSLNGPKIRLATTRDDDGALSQPLLAAN